MGEQLSYLNTCSRHGFVLGSGSAVPKYRLVIPKRAALATHLPKAHLSTQKVNPLFVGPLGN